MPTGRNKRKNVGNLPADFKRVKARVGKKAEKASKTTETAFKAASLHLSDQSIDRLSLGSSLVSTRGKTLTELMSQLSHPAAAVRLSAMKGLWNLVVNQKSTNSLRTFLSVFVRASAKSCVDEDQTIRSTGLSLFRDLFLHIDSTTMKPFASLLIAYALSALHSLDPPMRVDGARLVDLLSSAYPSLVKPSVSKLLPPFASLLSDYKTVEFSDVILKALVALLGVHNKIVREESPTCNEIDQPDLELSLGGHSRMTLLLERRELEHSLQLSMSLQDFVPVDQTREGLFYISTTKLDKEDGIPQKLYDLLSSLRDLLLEVTEHNLHTPGTEVSLRAMKPEKTIFTLQAIGLLWGAYGSDSSLDDCDGTGSKELSKLALKIVSHLLEVFPVSLDDARVRDPLSIERLNSMMCSVIMDLSSSFHDTRTLTNTSKLEWMSTICDYLAPHLLHFDGGSTPSSDLDVFCKLLLLGEGKISHSPGLLSLLNRVYLLSFEEDSNILRSSGGRKLLMTIIVMIRRQKLSLDEVEAPQNQIVGKILKKLPFCLFAWGTDFVHESMAMVTFLHELVRHTVNDKANPILASIREHMTKLLVDTRKSSKKAALRRSIFEWYPVSLQRKCLGLIVLLGSPSSETVKALASICSRSKNYGGSDISVSIVESIHSIRRQLPMQEYFTFLVQSIGLSKTKKKLRELVASDPSLALRWVLIVDERIRLVARLFTHCGSTRAYQMLLPILSSWLDPAIASYSHYAFLRSRAAVSLLATLTVDVKKKLDRKPSDLGTNDDMMQRLAVAIYEAFSFVSSHKLDMEERSKLVSPFFALIEAEPSLLCTVLKYFGSEFVKKEMNESKEKGIIQLLVDLFKDPRLTVSIATDSLNSIRSIKSTLSDGPASQLVASLEAFLEFKTQTRLLGF